MFFKLWDLKYILLFNMLVSLSTMYTIFKYRSKPPIQWFCKQKIWLPIVLFLIINFNKYQLNFIGTISEQLIIGVLDGIRYMLILHIIVNFALNKNKKSE